MFLFQRIRRSADRCRPLTMPRFTLARSDFRRLSRLSPRLVPDRGSALCSSRAISRLRHPTNGTSTYSGNWGPMRPFGRVCREDGSPYLRLTECHEATRVQRRCQSAPVSESRRWNQSRAVGQLYPQFVPGGLTCRQACVFGRLDLVAQYRRQERHGFGRLTDAVQSRSQSRQFDL